MTATAWTPLQAAPPAGWDMYVPPPAAGSGLVQDDEANVVTIAPLPAALRAASGLGDQDIIAGAYQRTRVVRLVAGAAYTLTGPLIVPPGTRLYRNAATLTGGTITPGAGALVVDEAQGAGGGALGFSWDLTDPPAINVGGVNYAIYQSVPITVPAMATMWGHWDNEVGRNQEFSFYMWLLGVEAAVLINPVGDAYPRFSAFAVEPFQPPEAVISMTVYDDNGYTSGNFAARALLTPVTMATAMAPASARAVPARRPGQPRQDAP